jgi:transcription elongation factor GreA
MVDVSYLTAEGEKRLRSELDELKGPARESLARRLRSAIQQGDLSENADYISAKEEQGFLEGRIQELDQVLKNAVIIDESKHIREKVDIGSHVTVQEDDYEPETYYVVGPKEADPKNNRISNESPIGRALLGHRVSDVVGVDIPDGSLKLRIVRID